MPVTIGALRESAPRETRVSVVPEVADKLAREGARILMERGAGVRACFPDSLYKSVTWADSAAGVLAGSDVILTVQPLTVEQIQQLKPGAVVVGFMQPHARTSAARACG
jgi:NAD(P) transhydrogenase subunit alpha